MKKFKELDFGFRVGIISFLLFSFLVIGSLMVEKVFHEPHKFYLPHTSPTALRYPAECA